MQVRNMIPMIFHHTNVENKFLLYDMERSRSKTSWQSEELVLFYPAALFSILLFFPQLCLYHCVSIRKKTMPNSLNSRTTLRMVHLDQIDFQKTCPYVPYEFRVSGCMQESRLVIPLELGILMGWLGAWDNPELLAVSGSQNCFASFKVFTLSCNSSFEP